MLKIYHNPRCSKSRETLALLTQRGLAPEIVLYLSDPLSAAQIKGLKAKLGFSSFRDMMRQGEADYKALGLSEAKESALCEAMAANPVLIERPIVETQNRAAIGRPPEQILSILPR